jgi:prepilin-type N-terminal cleavage/methylation domain-containing protein
MKIKKQTNKGFTLVELLVVISIIALLASVALPVMSSARQNAAVTTSTLQAGGIYKALMLYANDNDGSFPAADNSSNEGFRLLFPDYVQEEKPFYVPGSAWHDGAKGKKPDGDIGSKPDYAQALERGENHWAYIGGLNSSSSSQLPIIADGFTESVGQYTDVSNKKGGVWKGTKCIVVYCGGSATTEKLNAKNNFKPMKTRGGQEVELFSSAYNEELEQNNIKNPQE